MNRPRTVPVVLLAAVLVLAACGGDDDDAASSPTEPSTAAEPAATSDPPAGTDAPAGTDEPATPTTGPATITAGDQSGDGTSVLVDAVTLPTDGFVVIHADADGGPGPILGWSDLLPAGESSDVAVTLNEPLTATATVHPMAHVDANGNGEYEFMPPDVTIDVPATTADGAVAMLPITVTVESQGDSDDGSDGASEGEDAGGAAGLQLASTPLGDVLVDPEGWTLYLFTPDAQGASSCYDECEASWPVLTEVTDVGDGLDPTLLGTTTRDDGTVQATYNGWPLYYFAGDPGPGMTNGQGLNDVWWVVDAAGNAVGG